MTIKETILKQKGVWLFTTKANIKYVLDINNMMWDEYEWYKVGELHNTLDAETFDEILSISKSSKKIS